MEDDPHATTVEDLVEQSGGFHHLEIVGGQVRPLTDQAPAELLRALQLKLDEHVREHSLGTVHGIDERFLIERDPDTLLATPCSFVRDGRLPDPRPEGYLALAPDLAVEMAGSQTGADVDGRVAMWLGAGCQAVWVVDPEDWHVTCHRSGSEPQRLRPQDTLDGEDLVPGFRIRVASLFGLLSPRVLLGLGIPAELSLLAVAALLGLVLTGEPFPFHVRFDLAALWVTLAATLPMVIFAVLGTSDTGLRLPGLRGIHDRLERVIGPTLCSMRGWQLLALSLAAGIGEESLFRGVLQPQFGILATSLVFGLLHALTPTYFVLACVMSLYFGWLADATDNLVVPVGAHALYDAAALWLFRKRWGSGL